VILAGSGIDEKNALAVVKRTGVQEVHVRGTSRRKSGMKYRSRRVVFRSPQKPDDYVLEVTDEARIRKIVRRLGG